MENDRIRKTKIDNSGKQKKDFVKRIIYKEDSPVLYNDIGQQVTHRMGYAGVDNQFIVYPNVIRKNKTDYLTPLKEQQAIKYALDNDEYISFPDEKQAEWFSKNYKKMWTNK